MDASRRGALMQAWQNTAAAAHLLMSSFSVAFRGIGRGGGGPTALVVLRKKKQNASMFPKPR